jgi:hypothetical protein
MPGLGGLAVEPVESDGIAADRPEGFESPPASGDAAKDPMRSEG